MEGNNLFKFELNEAEDCWSVTGYNGKDEEIIFSPFHEGKPVKTIEADFSHNNKRIKRVTIPKGYTSIGCFAFRNCTGLTEINLPEGLIFIGDMAFYKCRGLTKINLPKSLTSINCFAFEDCTRIAEISVDENNPVFRTVDGVMFDKDMTTLMLFPEGKKGKYSVPEGIIAIRPFAFNNCKLTGIILPKSLLYIEDFNFDNERLKNITVNELNPNYCSIDGVLFNKEKSLLIKYPKNKEETDYIVPSGVLEISPSAFYRCKRLVNIVLPENIKFIHIYTFAGCKELKSVTLPMSLHYIAGYSFENCPNLETITLSRKTRIGYEVFKEFKGEFVYRD